MMARDYPAGWTWDTYARISDDPLDEQRGVRRQSDDTREVVEAAEGVTGIEHVENDTSAYRKKRVQVADPSGNVYYGYRVIRPVWHDALQRLRTGRADALVVYDLDRLARDPRDLEDAIEVVEHYGKTIVSATASEIDLTTESGRMNARMLVIMANKSSADTSRRVKRAARENALAGKPVGKRAFGWAEDRVHLAPKEAAAVREAVARLLGGATTVSAIAREWNEAGIETARGNTWRNVTVRQYLKHPRLAGYRVHHGEKRNTIVRDADGHPVMGKWEPLLDIATWERLQAVLTARPDTRGRVPRSSARHYLLSGILRCGICNEPMYGNVEKSRGTYYYRCTEYRHEGGAFPKHTQTIAGPLTDEAVSAALLAYLASQEDSEEHRPDGPAEWPGEADLERARRKVRELMEAFNNDQLPASVVFPQVQEWEGRAATLEAERQQWQARDTGGPLIDGILTEWPKRAGAGDTTWMRSAIGRVYEAFMVRPRATKGTNRFEYERLVPVPRGRDRKS